MKLKNFKYTKLFLIYYHIIFVFIHYYKVFLILCKTIKIAKTNNYLSTHNKLKLQKTD